MSPSKPTFPALEAGFRLEEWLVRPGPCELATGARTVTLRPKLMDVLVYLACRQGQVVSKQELVDAVWARKFIAEGTLAQAVFELRAALGDDTKSPRFIATVPKRGYRVVAAVTPLEPEPADTPPCVLVIGSREVALRPGDNIIGRAPDAAVRVDLFEVSRHHARIVLQAGGADIEDLGSKNGTYLRGERLTVRARLRDGDEVRIGPASLVFRELGAGSTRTQRR